MDSRSQSRAFIKLLNRLIWADEQPHFKEQAVFDLSTLQNIGTEILHVRNPEVEKIIINMLEFQKIGKNYPITYGKNSKTMDVTATLDDITDCQTIEQVYFSAFLKNGEIVKFGVKPPDKLECVATYRPLASTLIEEMGLLK